MIGNYNPIQASGLWASSGGWHVHMPFELVQFMTEGAGHQVVIVDQLAGGMARRG